MDERHVESSYHPDRKESDTDNCPGNHPGKLHEEVGQTKADIAATTAILGHFEHFFGGITTVEVEESEE